VFHGSLFLEYMGKALERRESVSWLCCIEGPRKAQTKNIGNTCKCSTGHYSTNVQGHLLPLCLSILVRSIVDVPIAKIQHLVELHVR
jgi:hypothetical protein